MKELKKIKIEIYEDTFEILREIKKKMRFQNDSVYDSIIFVSLQRELKLIQDLENRSKGK